MISVLQAPTVFNSIHSFKKIRALTFIHDIKRDQSRKIIERNEKKEEEGI